MASPNVDGIAANSTEFENRASAREGGITDIDLNANSEEIENLARFAVDEYNKKENALLEYKSVLKAQQQVVAGTMYYITLVAVDGGRKKIYEATIWEKPWQNFKELQDFKFIADVERNTEIENHAGSRAGGITDIEGSANSEEIENLARFAVDEYNKKENALLEYKRVLKAKQQVVAGTIYYITLVAVDGGQKKICEAKIWEKSWQNFKELQDFKFIADVPLNE